MRKHQLLRSQQNDVLSCIQNAGFDATEFAWGEAVSRHAYDLEVPALVHSASQYYFKFDIREERQACEYSPGNELEVEDDFPGDWPTQRTYVSYWLRYLRRELDAPDLWAAVAQQRELFGDSGGDDESNAPLTLPEREQIRASAARIREYIRAAGLTPDRLEFVEERLQYLVDSADRLGRKDWKLLALGVLSNIVVGAALAPDATRGFLHVAAAALSWLFGGPALLPHP